MEQKLMVFILIFGVFAFFAKFEAEGGKMPINCPSEAVCESIAPDDKPGMFTECEDSVRRRDDSRTICTVIYVYNPDMNFLQKMRNPNRQLCRVKNSEAARGPCETFVRTQSPVKVTMNGVVSTYCYTQFTPYFCKLGEHNYVTCSVQSVPCEDPCDAFPTNNNRSLLTGARKFLDSPLVQNEKKFPKVSFSV